MKKSIALFSLLIVLSLVLSACGPRQTPPTDLLSAIKARGYILVSTDPNYEPQSFLNTEGKRPANTKCPGDALTAAEMQGFDVDVAIAVGQALGVETCFATPSWDAITAGNWADKWDVSIGSMTITRERQKVLDFSIPYYYAKAMIAVHKDSGITSIDQLAGQALCVGTATTYETWLNGQDLGFPPTSIYAQPPANVTVFAVETDQECAQALAAGRKDFIGYVTSETVVDANIEAGMPVTKLATVFAEELAAAFDKASSLSTETLRAEVNKIFEAMHNDGRLSQLSIKWFGVDLTQPPQ